MPDLDVRIEKGERERQLRHRSGRKKGQQRQRVIDERKRRADSRKLLSCHRRHSPPQSPEGRGGGRDRKTETETEKEVFKGSQWSDKCRCVWAVGAIALKKGNTTTSTQKDREEVKRKNGRGKGKESSPRVDQSIDRSGQPERWPPELSCVITQHSHSLSVTTGQCLTLLLLLLLWSRP